MILPPYNLALFCVIYNAVINNSAIYDNRLIDTSALLGMLIVVLLSLLGTNSFKYFWKVFVVLSGKRKYTKKDLKNAKTVISLTKSILLATGLIMSIFGYLSTMMWIATEKSKWLFIFKLNNLTKTYKSVNALEHISLQIERSKIYGLIGEVSTPSSPYASQDTGRPEAALHASAYDIRPHRSSPSPCPRKPVCKCLTCMRPPTPDIAPAPESHC